MDIFHIYCNTAGNSGLYMQEIYEALKCRYSQIIFVNYYYPFTDKDIKRIFFKFTEIDENNKFNKYFNAFFRKVIRITELVIGYTKTLIFINKYKPRIINLSLTNMPFTIEYLWLIRRVSPNSKIIITCHDVLPYKSTSYINYDKIYNTSDYLLVHNKTSKEILLNSFNQDENKVLKHEFPLMDLSKIKSNENVVNYTDKNIKKFLFIGYMREEKGVDVLIKAWEQIGDRNDCKLTIAGFKPQDVKLDFSKIDSFKNVELVIKKLSDKEYINIVQDTDYVIFPYKQVGNSGVLSTIVSLNKIPIVSNLEVFIKNRFTEKEYTFKSENTNDLTELLRQIINDNNMDISSKKKILKKKVKQSKEFFKKEVLDAYSNILI